MQQREDTKVFMPATVIEFHTFYNGENRAGKTGEKQA
jgi:hypothetical protein